MNWQMVLSRQRGRLSGRWWRVNLRGACHALHQPRASSSRAASLAGLAVILVGFGACSQAASPPAPGSASTGTPVTSSASTTTTTILPVPVGVVGSRAAGTFGFLGKAERVPVATVPRGATSSPLPVPGSPGFLGIDRIAFRHFGSGPDLLLITGQDVTMTAWSLPLLTVLAQHYRVTIFDLPGTGYSGPLPAQLSLDRWADDTAGLVYALQLVHPTVLGWGLGGEVALSLAERHPGSVGALVLVDSSAAGPGATPPSRAVRGLIGSPFVTPTQLGSLFFSSRFAGAESAWLQGTQTIVPDDITQPALAAEARLQLGLWKTRALVAAASAIHVPTLVVSGTDDVLFPAPDGALLAGAIAGAKSIVYQGVDYASMMELTSRFVGAVESFTG